MNKTTMLNFEGNNYFQRNCDNLFHEDDIIIKNIDLTNQTVLEIGCSNGWRLNHLRNKFSNATYYGIDPSNEAIEYGVKNFQNVNLNCTTCDTLPYANNAFDIILVPFVFMYIDRELLFKSCNEIDRILKNNGRLIITDFYSNRNRKNKYKHLDDIFIYKQPYFDIFLSTQNYVLKKLETYESKSSNDNDKYDDTCFYVELVKDINFIN